MRRPHPHHTSPAPPAESQPPPATTDAAAVAAAADVAVVGSGCSPPWLWRCTQRYLLLTLFVAPWLLAARQVVMLLTFSEEYQWVAMGHGGTSGHDTPLMPPSIHTRTLLPSSSDLASSLAASNASNGPVLSWPSLQRMKRESIYDDDCRLKPNTINPASLPRSQPLPLSYSDYTRCADNALTPDTTTTRSPGDGGVAVVDVPVCGIDYLSKTAPRKPCTYTIQEGEDGVGALYSRSLVAMVYAYQQGCDFVFSDPPANAWNDGASYHNMPQIGPVYCHTTKPPTDPEPAKHKPPPSSPQGWQDWWSGLSCYAVDWPSFLNLPRLTKDLVRQKEEEGGVLCRVHFNQAHRYLSLLGTQRLQGPVERAVETLRHGVFATAGATLGASAGGGDNGGGGGSGGRYHCQAVSKGLGVINVALHIRRGDRTNRKDNPWDAPFSIDYYINIIKALDDASPPGRVLHFHIYTETVDPQPSPTTTTTTNTTTTTSSSKRRSSSGSTSRQDVALSFPELPGFLLRKPSVANANHSSYYVAELQGLNKSSSKQRIHVHANGDPAQAFHCMVNADVLVLSPSSLSYVMAWATRAVLVYPYFKLKDDLIVLNSEYALKRAAGALLWLDQDGHNFIPVMDERGDIDPQVATRRMQAIRQHRRQHHSIG